MTGCRSHGELIGPYVLGGLDPDEIEEMARHISQCERCAAERRQLASLPALLDRAQAEETIATLSPELEDAVLDRFVQEQARERRPARSWPRFAIPAAAAAAAVAVVVGVVLSLALPGGGESSYARAELWSTSGGALGSARVAEVDGGTRVDLSAHHLPVAREAEYELWCVRTDGRWISGGSFRARPNGTAAAQLSAAVAPGEYHMMVITRRSEGGERGAEVMRGKLSY